MTRTIKIKHIIFLMMCFYLALASCTSNNNTSNKSATPISGQMVADTIIYSVVIKNPNPNDEWTNFSLSKLDRKKLVDALFESVYDNNAQAFNYVSDAPMSASDVKDVENQEDFSRDKVAKLQFWESWYYDEEQALMTKKVHSVLVAYEVRSEQNELLGYKAAFYVNSK